MPGGELVQTVFGVFISLDLYSDLRWTLCLGFRVFFGYFPHEYGTSHCYAL